MADSETMRARAREEASRPFDPEVDSPFTDEEYEAAAAAGNPAAKAFIAETKRRAAQQDRAARELYAAGRAEERRAAKARVSRRRKTAPAKRRRRASATGRQAVRLVGRASHPVRAASSGSLTGLLVGSLGMVLLYVFIQSADAVSGFLGGIRSAIDWFADPTKTITFNK
jgi:hypothetical protein